MSLFEKIKLKNFFSSPESTEEPNGGNGTAEPASEAAAKSTPAAPAITPPSPREAQADNWQDEPPKERVTIQAPVLADAVFPEASDEIRILAQPSAGNDQCVFKVNRQLTKGYSWFFANFESAAGSPLAEALFSLDDVETVLVLESTLTITRKDKTLVDWKPLAEEVGKEMRRVIQEGGELIDPKIPADLPTEEMLRNDIQNVIDTEVNPGVAAHGGRITLLDVKGNTITIQMGGGCQGCSAADLTLKQGIHTAFRTAVPKVGAILDETDHSAGLNPYFS